MKSPRLVLADDHTLVLQGIRKMLEGRYEVAGTCRDGRELLQEIRQQRPDIVLMDITMPTLNGIEAARRLKRSEPEIKVIFLTMHSEAAYVSEAFRVGASGYLLKWSAEEELGAAIQAAVAGRRYLTRLLPQQWLDRATARGTAEQTPDGQLTARERQVLQLVAEGHSAKEIGNELHISTKTVEFHKYRMMKKLAVRTTPELTRYAIQHGIVSF